MNKKNKFHFKPITIVLLIISTIILLVYSLTVCKLLIDGKQKFKNNFQWGEAN